MEKHIIDEKTGISYTLHGDYYLPDLEVPDEKEYDIGIYGERHGRWLKEHKKAVYSHFLTTGKFPAYLAEINEQAHDRFDLIVKQMANAQGITEKLKSEDQMAWICRMNNVRAVANEIINSELIYT